MSMGLPLFLLFCVYGGVNVYLPVLLSGLGYSATMIGILQGIFEAAGLVFPIFVSSKVDRKGNYGTVMVLLGVLMAAVLPPLVLFNKFWVTALVLALFAVGFKGSVPVADALVSRVLGDDRVNYGKVRVLGSIGFVCITLLFQFTPLVNPDSASSIAFWMGLPALLFALSVLVIPGLLRVWPRQDSADASINATAGESTRAVTGESAMVSAPNATLRPSNLLTTSTAKVKGALSVLAEFPFPFWAGIGLIFLGYLGMTPTQRFFSLYVREYLHLESYAGLWALSAAAEVPLMFLSGRFIRKYGTERILVVSLAAIAVRNLVYAAFPSFGGAVLGQLFHAICFGLFHPAAVVFVTERAPKRLMVVGMTLYSSVSVGIASVLGNVMGGFVIDSFGYIPLFTFFSVFPAVGLIAFFALRGRFIRRY
ncbi:MAG TPA: MFS transporter [Treponemataceae bacterium]|nr:MFS transporter [Treponemataceae bacterium]